MLYKQKMFVIQAFFSIGGGGNWVNFWQIYAAGISEPLPNYNLFCSREDPISVAFEQKYCLQSQLTHFLSLFKP